MSVLSFTQNFQEYEYMTEWCYYIQYWTCFWVDAAYTYIWPGVPVVRAFTLFTPRSDINCLNVVAENWERKVRPGDVFPQSSIVQFRPVCQERCLAWPSAAAAHLLQVFHLLCGQRRYSLAVLNDHCLSIISSHLSHQQGLFPSTQLDSSSFLGTFSLNP